MQLCLQHMLLFRIYFTFRRSSGHWLGLESGKQFSHSLSNSWEHVHEHTRCCQSIVQLQICPLPAKMVLQEPIFVKAESSQTYNSSPISVRNGRQTDPIGYDDGALQLDVLWSQTNGQVPRRNSQWNLDVQFVLSNHWILPWWGSYCNYSD